jgi:hypothetical protein
MEVRCVSYGGNDLFVINAKSKKIPMIVFECSWYMAVCSDGARVSVEVFHVEMTRDLAGEVMQNC